MTVLPYNGTSGWSGSEASQHRQMFIDETGETGKRQKDVIQKLRQMGMHGATWREIATALSLHHGQASAALSVLHRAGQISRLTDKRNRCSVYVANNYVNGRTTAESSKTKSSINNKVINELLDLHTKSNDGTNICMECKYVWPCDTINIIRGDYSCSE
jgi:hypothetical protein